MKNNLLLIFIVYSIHIYSQKETTWWPIGSHVFLDFSNPTIPTHNFLSNAKIMESTASISDNLGNLIFYTNGDTIYDKNNVPLPNGQNINSTYYSSLSVTQGSMFIKKPGNNALYFLFNLSETATLGDLKLQYHCLDPTVNNNNGDVIFKNQLNVGSFAEKLTATKHCNNINVWLVTVRFTKKDENIQEDNPPIYLYNKNEIEFLSYLITENGVQNEPIHSVISLPSNFQFFGQLKFNSKGNLLATADPSGIDLFDFDKETGIVSYNKRISAQLNNGYGVEFSPNDEFLYINEKQYHFDSNTITPLLNYDCPAQLQRGLDDKIYRTYILNSEIVNSTYNIDNNFFYFGNTDNTFRITQIAQPNLLGISCDYNSTYIYEFQPNYNDFPIGMPNFPSFYFHHPQSEFYYSGACENDSTLFYLANSASAVDSIKWSFDDTNESVWGDSITHFYAQSGNMQVQCITFSNGISDTSFQCVSICGKGNVQLPASINLCDMNEAILNGMNPCSLEYLWNTGDTTSAITVNTPGNYVLTTTNSCGVYYDSVQVINENCVPIVEIPNVFTPNNDGLNDVFSINVKNVVSFNYYIINRWGNVITSNSILSDSLQIHTSTKINLWDGLSNNQMDSSDGVYFYRIELEYLNQTTDTKTGFFHLLH